MGVVLLIVAAIVILAALSGKKKEPKRIPVIVKCGSTLARTRATRRSSR